MRRLILFRHAKADWPKGASDIERPLTDRGRADAALVGGFLAKNGLRPDAAVVSAARRARETWEFAAAALPAPPPAAFNEQIYDARAETLLAVLREAPDEARSLLIIGHNPGMEELARALAASKHGARRSLAAKFPTAGLMVIDFETDAWRDVKPDTGRLVRYVTPKILRGEK
jgi:phosphohistidine phosphatase